MRARTITAKPRTKGEARHFALALVLGISALVVPVCQARLPIRPSRAGPQVFRARVERFQPARRRVGVLARQLDRATRERTGSPSGPGDSSLNGEPTFVSDPPAATGDGFDWWSAAVGAGAVLALLALGGASLLTARSR